MAVTPTDIKPQPADRFSWIDTPAGPALICRALEPFARHLFTTRRWALGSAVLDDAARRAAWRELAAVMGVAEDHLARLHQVHGAEVVFRHDGAAVPPDMTLPCADIVVTTDRSLTLAVQTADCVPILMADSQNGAVAAAHAGWRGLAARVPGTAVRALVDGGGSRPDRIIAAIGPAISAERYEVGADVRDRFERAGFDANRLDRWFPAATRPGHWLFDGWASARDQLTDAGVPADQIHVAGLCTATHDRLLCSYRRDGKRAGRMAAAIRPLST